MSDSTIHDINLACNDIRDLLISKNISYGDSALQPVRMFSKTNIQEQLAVRIDDKLSRISRGHEYVGDDTIDDLIGYLVLMKIARRRSNAEKE
jgi:hypothetical protein